MGANRSGCLCTVSQKIRGSTIRRHARTSCECAQAQTGRCRGSCAFTCTCTRAHWLPSLPSLPISSLKIWVDSCAIVHLVFVHRRTFHCAKVALRGVVELVEPLGRH